MFCVSTINLWKFYILLKAQLLYKPTRVILFVRELLYLSKFLASTVNISFKCTDWECTTNKIFIQNRGNWCYFGFVLIFFKYIHFFLLWVGYTLYNIKFQFISYNQLRIFFCRRLYSVIDYSKSNCNTANKNFL